MKIALYVPHWPPGSSANGIVTYAACLVPALRQLGHEVYVLTTWLTANETDRYTIHLSKMDVRISPWLRLLSRFSIDRFVFHARSRELVAAITKLQLEQRIDVLEIEDSFGWGAMIAKKRLVPLVVRLHGPWFLNGNFDGASNARYRRRVRLEGHGIEAATLITAPSANVLQNVRSYYRVELDQARVIPNPIDAGPETAPWRLSSCDKNRILFVGRFDRRKGADIVLRAFARLAEFYPNLRLSFVGPDDGILDGEERLSFNQFVRKNLPASCWPRIDFHGQLPHRDVIALRNQHFLTVVASQFEILPYAVLEAMSLGCPVIASSVGGIPELIRHQRNGLLFESQNVDQLVLACRTLLDDHGLAESLGTQAMKDSAAAFNAASIASKTIEAYQTAIQLHRAK